MGGLAMVTMTTGGRSEQVDLGDSNSEQLRHCPGDTRVTFGLFAYIPELAQISHYEAAGSLVTVRA
jgi:hypothetical protein